MDFNKLGWNAFLDEHSLKYQNKHFYIGRICSEHKNSYKLLCAKGELTAVISGKFRNECNINKNYPAVGDWVAFDLIENENKAIIQDVLPRKSRFCRKAAGQKTEEQVIAANIDTAFIVCALNYDFNLRRIERYLSLTWQSGITPVIVLAKPDLCQDLDKKLLEVESIAFGVDIHVVNNLSKDGIKQLEPYCKEGQTIILLGSSGVGKSSLINNLLHEDRMQIKDLRKNIDKGQHTTTHRQMLIIPTGGLIIDTPGMRELQLWDADEGLSNCFEEIETLALNCRFNDCKHQNEPDCAIQQAINDGQLDIRRLENYSKMLKEQEYLISCQNQNAAQVERKKWKNIHKQIKKHYKE